MKGKPQSLGQMRNAARKAERRSMPTAEHVGNIVDRAVRGSMSKEGNLIAEQGKALMRLNDQFMAETIYARVESTFAHEWNKQSLPWREDYCNRYLPHLSKAIEALHNIKSLGLGYSQEHVRKYANDLLQGKTRLRYPFPENSDDEPRKLKELVVRKTDMLNRMIESLPEKSERSLAESILRHST